MSDYKYKNEPVKMEVESFGTYFYCNHMSATIYKDIYGEGEVITCGYRGCNDGEIPLTSIWHLDEIDDMVKCLQAAKAFLSKKGESDE